MPRVSLHRQRYWRRNFARMYPEAGEQSRRQLQRYLRWRQIACVAFVLLVLGALVKWLAWGLR